MPANPWRPYGSLGHRKRRCVPSPSGRADASRTSAGRPLEKQALRGTAIPGDNEAGRIAYSAYSVVRSGTFPVRPAHSLSLGDSRALGTESTHALALEDSVPAPRIGGAKRRITRSFGLPPAVSFVGLNPLMRGERGEPLSRVACAPPGSWSALRVSVALETALHRECCQRRLREGPTARGQYMTKEAQQGAGRHNEQGHPFSTAPIFRGMMGGLKLTLGISPSPRSFPQGAMVDQTPQGDVWAFGLNRGEDRHAWPSDPRRPKTRPSLVTRPFLPWPAAAIASMNLLVGASPDNLRRRSPPPPRPLRSGCQSACRTAGLPVCLLVPGLLDQRADWTRPTGLRFTGTKPME